MIYKTTSEKSLQEVKQTLETQAKKHAFGVLHHYEFKKILENKGFPIEQDITVYELCNPKAAHAVLSEIAEASVFLPCRISLYEENGKTVLATINLEGFINGLNASDALDKHLRQVYKDFISLLNSF